MSSVLKWITKERTLIAGPYVGEFGWELMEWQGFVRKLSAIYGKTIAVSYNSSRYLYESCEFQGHDLKLEKSGFGYGDHTREAVKSLLERTVGSIGTDRWDLLRPWDLTRVRKLLIGKQKFIRFSEKPLKGEPIDILFHFRNLGREDGMAKNYPYLDADHIVNYFRDIGLNTGCVGLPDLSYCANSSSDLRSADLQFTISAICSARLVAGGSSGPMHLAALCGKPIVVWSGVDAERYRSSWNPFRSKVSLVSDTTFRPSRESVIEQINMALKSV